MMMFVCILLKSDIKRKDSNVVVERFRKCFMFQKGASPIENPVKPKVPFLHVLVFFEAKVLIQRTLL